MSQGYHQGIYGFHEENQEDDQHQHHVAQQSRRDKLRMQGLIDPTDEDEPSGSGIYNAGAAGAGGSMLQDMFNFSTAVPGPSATDLLASQMQAAAASGYATRPFNLGFGASWHGGAIEDSKELSQHHHHPDSAAAMNLFLMNPHNQQQQQQQTDQELRVQNNPFGVVESTQNQGLSLSLSSLLQPDQELRVRDGVLYFNNNNNNSNIQSQQLQQLQQTHGQPSGQSQHIGYGGGASVGVVNVLRNSKYSRAAQELLEEFCSVGRGQQFKGKKTLGRQSSISNNPNADNNSNTNASSSSNYKDGPPSLSTADRFEHQRKKSKLLSMLDEVDRRYNHYCDQMQMVVNSFDSVMGFGAATPYTALAQKAMSRHFKCLKDAISVQLKNTCEILGEKEAAGGSGITKGETPRLRLLDQSLRQQRAFHQMGMMEQEAWRPQRGLPERSVTILRAWLFEHFLHPYPSDADKHLLARQTGLSRNQVSNWFINARVRLWKPMVEDMYQQEAKEQNEAASTSAPSDHHESIGQNPNANPNPNPNQHSIVNKGPDPDADRFSSMGPGPSMMPIMAPDPNEDDLYSEYGSVGLGPGSRRSGDVSLTLGLRHTGNAPDQKNRPYTIRDFGC